MYSQNQEEKIILEYFKDFKGTFIDVGANDGITLSNTRALMDRGWAGVCVEPSPSAFEKLKANTEQFLNVYCYPFALGETNGKVEMWDSGEHLGKGDSGLLSTMSEDDYNKWKASTKFNKIQVQCFRWKTFLNRLKYKQFDFISMDIEGMEVSVLNQIELRAVKMVCVEWNSKPEAKEKFDVLMMGFRLIYTSTENLIYAR